MKRMVLTGVLSLLAGVVITIGAFYFLAPSFMLLENESKYGFNESVERFEASVKEAGWKMPKVHDLQETMFNHGKNVKAVKVFELCHPEHAAKILEKNNERIVSVMMPCRVAIYEKNDGKVYISRMNSRLMASTMGKVISEVMAEAAKENETMLKSIIRQ